MCNTQQITEVPPKSATASVSLSVEDKLYLTILFYQYKRLLDSTLTSSATGSQGKQAVLGRPYGAELGERGAEPMDKDQRGPRGPTDTTCSILSTVLVSR